MHRFACYCYHISLIYANEKVGHEVHQYHCMNNRHCSRRRCEVGLNVRRESDDCRSRAFMTSCECRPIVSVRSQHLQYRVTNDM